MKKHFQKMLALLLCICLFASGINVYAAEVTSSSVAEQFNPTQDKSVIRKPQLLMTPNQLSLTSS